MSFLHKWLGQKTTGSLSDYSALAVDMHAHWLPGIDDGAKNMEESLALIRHFYDMGFRHLIATPHVMADLYPNTPAIIQEKLQLVREAVGKEGIAVTLDAAAEYLMDEAFGDKIKSGTLLTLPGNRVLVEMSFVSAPPHLDQYIFQLQTKGYKVVLAHPERYLFFRDQYSRYRDLKNRGVLFQMNLLSLAGYYGLPTKENALQLLKDGMIDFFGTDMHHERHARQIAALLDDKKSNRLLAEYLPNMLNPTLSFA
ncbi:MAG: CpsB/CapC family capsule biosynthesis tyrosine phosphatase [Saprospiraceae bacterium]